MSNHQVLNPEDHKDLRVHTGAGAHLGDGVMAVLAVPAEFRRLACDFPILFRFDPAGRAFSALALLGFEPGENLCLDGAGWTTAERPLALAVQPFLIGRRSDGEGAQIHIDMDHPRVSQDGEGMRLFDEDGRPTPYVEQIADLLGELDQGYRASTGFYAALARYDLLEPFALDVTLGDGTDHRLVGYHLVNEEKLRGLEPGALAELHGEGHLMPLFMAVASLGNLAKLARRRGGGAHG